MKNIHLILVLLFSIKAIGQVEHTKNTEYDSKVLANGERYEGKKDGYWVKYYNPKYRYVSSVNDTLYKSKGNYIYGKKNGKWYFYGNPRVINKKLPYDYVNNLDSIVTYNNDKIINVYVFNWHNYLKKKITKNDSLIITTHYFDNKIMVDNINCNRHISSINTSFLNKELKIEKYYSKNGNPKKEFFIDETKKPELLKVWRKNGSLSFERTSYKKNYDFIVYYENGTVFKIEKYRNSKLFNAIYYGKNGELLDLGNFKNGNGILKTYDMTSNLLSQQLEYENGEYIRNIKN